MISDMRPTTIKTKKKKFKHNVYKRRRGELDVYVPTNPMKFMIDRKQEKHRMTTPDHICSCTTSPDVQYMADSAYDDTPTHDRLMNRPKATTYKFNLRT